MDLIRNWVKEFLIIYLILTILLHLAASDKYRKYIRFFSGLILLTFLASPMFQLFGASGQLEARIAYESFWEQLDSTKQDTERLTFLKNDYYVQKYEEAIAQDIERQAAEQEIALKSIDVALSEDYEIQKVEVVLDTSRGESAAVMEQKLTELLKAGYRLENEQILIR